jgi:hypothetical protein
MVTMVEVDGKELWVGTGLSRKCQAVVRSLTPLLGWPVLDSFDFLDELL